MYKFINLTTQSMSSIAQKRHIRVKNLVCHILMKKILSLISQILYIIRLSDKTEHMVAWTIVI